MGEFSSSDTSESSVPVSVSTVQIFISSPEIYLKKTNKPLSHPMCSGVLSCTETQEYWNGGGKGLPEKLLNTLARNAGHKSRHADETHAMIWHLA